MLPRHWINADEGAHLMDARLVMAGLVPGVDFNARQPLYVLSYVPFLALAGDPAFPWARLQPVLSTLGAGLLLAWLGRRLGGPGAGTVALAAFLYSPTVFFDAAVVKTEPLAILLAAAAMACLTAWLQDGRLLWMVGAGVAAGAGFYVRESVLGALLAAAFVGLLQPARARALAALAAGALATWAAALGLACLAAPWSRVVASDDLNPALPILARLGKMAGWAGGEISVRDPGQDWRSTWWRLREALVLNLGLLAALPLGAALSRGRWRQPEWLVPLAWLGVYVGLYAYHVANRGFYQYYLREVLAPLALLGGVALARLLPAAACRRAAGAAVAGCAGLYGAVSMLGPWPARPDHPLLEAAAWAALAPALALGLAGVKALQGADGPAARRALGGAALAFGLSAVLAGRLCGLRYDCLYSPATVVRVAAEVRRVAGPQDEVMSGAVIWEFEAGRRPYAGVSHPLRFKGGMRPEDEERLQARVDIAPPRVVVRDQDLLSTWLFSLGGMRTALGRDYAEVLHDKDSGIPVGVLVRRPGDGPLHP